MNITAWFHTITRGDSQRAVAQKVGIQQSRLSRQLKAGDLDAEIVRDISRAYGSRAGDELLAIGFLTADDLQLIGVDEALGLATNSELLAELNRRVDPEARRIFRGEGNEVIDLVDDAEIIDLHDLSEMPYVADSSPDEPGEGDEGYHDGP